MKIQCDSPHVQRQPIPMYLWHMFAFDSCFQGVRRKPLISSMLMLHLGFTFFHTLFYAGSWTFFSFKFLLLLYMIPLWNELKTFLCWVLIWILNVRWFFHSRGEEKKTFSKIFMGIMLAIAVVWRSNRRRKKCRPDECNKWKENPNNKTVQRWEEHFHRTNGSKIIPKYCLKKILHGAWRRMYARGI